MNNGKGKRIKAVFVDRDGTINKEVEYLHKPEEFTFEPGAVEGLRLLKDSGLLVFVVTNQAGIARGYYTEDDYHILTAHMEAELAGAGVKLDGVYHCPHHPEGAVPELAVKCRCRKPETGMMEPVMRQYELKAEETALVGDKNSDIEAGRRLGLETWLVETGYGKKEKAHTRADHLVKDLLAAARDIVRIREGKE